MEKDIFNISKNELSYGRGYVYSLQYHLIWCTKYRKKILKDGLDTEGREMLEALADAGWYEENNDPTPFIRYMLQVILACYIEFEERVGLMTEKGSSSSAYDIVKKYVGGKLVSLPVQMLLHIVPV